MDGYSRINRQNPKILFYNILSDITCKIPILGKKLEKSIQEKKITSIQKKYSAFSFQINRVLNHTATSDEVIQLYEAGIPLVNDYFICLKQQKFLTREILDCLDNWNVAQLRNPEAEYCIILDIILACKKKIFSSGWDVISAYCFGLLSKEQTLLEIEKIHIQIPKTIKLIEMGCKDNSKIENTYHKEVKS